MYSTTFLYNAFLVSLLLATANLFPLKTDPNMITVPDDYFSIQEAIDHSRSGDTIFVKSGIYFEKIVIDKNELELIGQTKSTTIIDGNKIGNTVYIEANNTQLRGFTIQNSGYNLTDSGIYLNNSFNSFVSNNRISSNNIGVYISYSPNSILENNNITGNKYNFGISGQGLQDYIQDIDVSNVVDGKPVIYWVNQQDKTVPSDAGCVAIINSTKITVEDVTLTKNWQAILYAYTTNSTIKNVTVTSNLDAIWLINCSNCTVYANNINGNKWGGIALVNSFYCLIHGNNITDNKEYGIFLSYSSDNLFYHNNLSNNTRQAWLHGTNYNRWDAGNTIGGNYWKNYVGKDSNNDGIGDNPYNIDENNKDNYPLMQPQVLSSHETTSRKIFLYFVTVIGIIVVAIAIIVRTYVLKHRKSSAVKCDT